MGFGLQSGLFIPTVPLPHLSLTCPAPLLARKGRTWLTLSPLTPSASGLGVAVHFLCVPADSCSSPLPVRASGLVWRFLKQWSARVA